MEDVDVAVIGAGQGGIYSAYRFATDGLSVIGIDGGANFGGVWFHNRYPGARVDSDSIDYCFHFSKELYSNWRWPERYGDAPTLYQYHNFVADQLNVRNLFRFNTWLRDAVWSATDNRWHLTTDKADQIRCRFLVMCTGALAAPKPLNFPGLHRYKGEWVQTNRWPLGGIDLDNRRIGIIGTGSSGAQAVPELAQRAKQLYVFQRHPHHAIPAQNRPSDPGLQDAIARDLDSHRENSLHRGGPADPKGGATRMHPFQGPTRPADSYTPGQRREVLESQWEFGGHGMSYLFSDEATNPDSNAVVADFIREKIRERVKNPAVAETLSPRYPVGTRRLILEIGYYEAFNQDNVTLVDALDDPIVEVTETGVRTQRSSYDVDLLIFAIGFRAFVGPLQDAGIRNESGVTPKDVWADGPRTLFGLMTPGFPNMFHPTNAGSPSVLGNAMLQHEFFGDWISQCISSMDKAGHSSIEASYAAATEWMGLVDSYAQRIMPIRRGQDQYMVHVNQDGSRRFMPFCAGMGEYLPLITKATEQDYAGFDLN